MKKQKTAQSFKQLSKLKSPQKIQDFLDKIPINKEKDGETLTAVEETLKRNKAHCLEGALMAAYALKLAGYPPLLMDLKAEPSDFDHVVAIFKQDGHWGAISKTNHAVLRYREPIYKNVRELAMSFFHEYFTHDGKKTLRSFSKPFNLNSYKKDWIHSKADLWDLEKKIDRSPHYKILTAKQKARLRRAHKTEIKAGKITEW